MNRHYDGARVREVLTKLRAIQRSDGITLNIGADLIAGFPGETEADFQETLTLIDTFHITQLHAFPFSGHIDHYSVPAGAFENQIPNHISQSRTKILLEHGHIQKHLLEEETYGKTVAILVEKCEQNGTFSGWSQNYIACNEGNTSLLSGEKAQRGKIARGIYTPNTILKSEKTTTPEPKTACA